MGESRSRNTRQLAGSWFNRDETGELIGFAKVTRDITERHGWVGVSLA